MLPYRTTHTGVHTDLSYPAFPELRIRKRTTDSDPSDCPNTPVDRKIYPTKARIRRSAYPHHTSAHSRANATHIASLSPTSSPRSSPAKSKRPRTLSANGGMLDIVGFVISDSENEDSDGDDGVQGGERKRKKREILPSPLQNSFSFSRVLSPVPCANTSNDHIDRKPQRSVSIVPSSLSQPAILPKSSPSSLILAVPQGIEPKAHLAARKLLILEKKNEGEELNKVFEMVYGRGMGFLGNSARRMGRGSGLRPVDHTAEIGMREADKDMTGNVVEDGMEVDG